MPIEAIEVVSELTLGELIVGVGTLALAGFTWWLARKTGQEVKKTDETLRLSRENIEAIDRPFVIGIPAEGEAALEIRDLHAIRSLAMRLSNVGKGPAVVGDIRLTADGATEILARPDVQTPVAAASWANAHPEVTAAFPTDGVEERAEAVLTIYYTHAAGNRYMTKSNVEIRGTYVVCRDFVRSAADDGEREMRDPADL
jgi:hypothetical protein